MRKRRRRKKMRRVRGNRLTLSWIFLPSSSVEVSRAALRAISLRSLSLHTRTHTTQRFKLTLYKLCITANALHCLLLGCFFSGPLSLREHLLHLGLLLPAFLIQLHQLGHTLGFLGLASLLCCLLLGQLLLSLPLPLIQQLLETSFPPLLCHTHTHTCVKERRRERG